MADVENPPSDVENVPAVEPKKRRFVYASNLIDYLKDIKVFLMIATCLFVGFFIVGYATPYFAAPVSDAVVGSLETSYEPYADMNPLQIWISIASGNVLRALLAGFGGILLVPTLVFITVNGLGMGMMIQSFVVQLGLFVTLVGILPHGILEIPLLIISTAIGFRLSWSVILRVAKSVPFLPEFKRTVRMYVLYVIPAFLLAATIETFITSVLLYLVTR
jgi:stage II sporulation protein M